MMNQQQQHSSVNPMAGNMASSNVQHRNMMGQQQQRGAPQQMTSPSKGPYQMQQQSTALSRSQLAHLQMNSYHKQKQITPEMTSHMYPAGSSAPTQASLPTQNGNYQNMAVGHASQVDSSQMMSQQHQFPAQPHQQHPYQSQQPTPATQHTYQTYQQQQQQQQHHLMHQQHQQQQPQHSLVQPQVQQQPQAFHQQVQQQLQHHLQHQQRNTNNQHQQQQQQQQQHSRYHKQQHHQVQPKQILQHSPGKSSMSPQSPNAANQSSTAVTPSSPQSPAAAVTAVGVNGQAGGEEANNTTDAQSKVSSTSDKDAGQESETKDKSKDNTSASNASETQSLANTKEKTPMCLINELARFNKMNHQYTLVDEQGPAHKKTFYVKLKLGDEEYSASGESIKKAQHAAAAIAYASSKYPHPPPKPNRQIITMDKAGAIDGTITPTVELNALAMKRGEAAHYKAIEPRQPPYGPSARFHGGPPPSMDFRGMYNQRYHQYMRGGRDPRYRGGGVLWPLRYFPRMNRAFCVSLRVGHREFIGDGGTRQAARHSAAQKALKVLKHLPPHAGSAKEEEEPPQQEAQAQAEGSGSASSVDDSLKSEISLVHEIALRRNMVVQFEVVRETGPPHMKNFVTRCTVADMQTEGEGNSKKCSKKMAADLMLEELRKLPPLNAPSFPRPKSKIQVNKKKNRNLVKSELQQQKADPNYGVGINPIGRLIQIMQAQKKKEPVYTLVTERGLPRRREFIVQVEVEGQTVTGSGPNKKLAKRAAAEAMLQLLGCTKPSPQPVKSSIKHTVANGENGQTNGDKKVTFVEGDSPGDGEDPVPSSGNQQRVPGLLHLPNKPANNASNSGQPSPPSKLVNLQSILKPNLRPEIQLRELCKAMEVQLEIDDFTKKRPAGTEHITRITIGSSEPQAFHGSNSTVESSRDMAAMDALKVLLATVKDVQHPGGDGHQVSKSTLVARTPLPVGAKKEVSK